MECPVCGRWGRGDPQAGYDADEICPRCAREGWERAPDGTLVGPDDARDSLPRPRMQRASLAAAPSLTVRRT